MKQFGALTEPYCVLHKYASTLSSHSIAVQVATNCILYVLFTVIAVRKAPHQRELFLCPKDKASLVARQITWICRLPMPTSITCTLISGHV